MTEARSRILYPLVLSGGLLGLYAFLQQEVIRSRRAGTVSEALFGAGHRWLLFIAIVPLIVVAVRAVDALAFDVALSRRKMVAAPRLLRDMVALVLYFLLFSWATSTLFQYRLTNLLTATTVVAAVVGLALQETLGNLFSGIEVYPRRNLNPRVVQVTVDGDTPPADAMPVLTEATSKIEGVSQEYEHRDRMDADVRKAIWYALRGKASTDRQPQ